MNKCVICKQRIIPPSDSKRGLTGTTYVQWCPSCGNFEIADAAVCILDDAVGQKRRTRQEVVDHFSKIIKGANRSGKTALITDDDAQVFGFEDV